MKKLLRSLLLAFSSLAAVAAPVIFDSGTPTPQLGGWASDPGYSLQLGAKVTLGPGVSTVTQVVWWGGYCCHGYAPQDWFSLQVFNLTGGTPSPALTFEASLIAISRISTGALLQGVIEQYEYVAVLQTPFELAGNSDYVVSLVNDTSTDIQNWFWSIHSTESGTWFRGNETRPWALEPYTMAFRLEGSTATIPESSSLALTLLGMIILLRSSRSTPVRSSKGSGVTKGTKGTKGSAKGSGVRSFLLPAVKW